MVLMSLEDFQLCPKGEGGPYVADGNLRLDGPLPMNTHGGNLAEAYAHGMSHVYEAVHQVRGHGDRLQVRPTPRRARDLRARARRRSSGGSWPGPVAHRSVSEQMDGLPGPRRSR